MPSTLGFFFRSWSYEIILKVNRIYTMDEFKKIVA